MDHSKHIFFRKNGKNNKKNDAEEEMSFSIFAVIFAVHSFSVIFPSHSTLGWLKILEKPERPEKPKKEQ